ncbi:MAG: RNA polymerase sigma-70 factor (ECF subfamily) [Verrucomicrobiales bacterium]|jgi:RNA polymerase sigma-70 factor (ECF subfamily)
MPAPDHTTEVQALFVQHIAPVKHFVLSLLPNPSEAEDVVQEVFLTITAKANDFQTGTNFKAWAFAIARFKVLELLRRNRRDQNRLSDEVIEQLAAEAEDPNPGQDSATMRALAKCLEKLAPKPRKMIELQYQDELKPAVIAERLGWEPNAIYVALSRARSSLRKCIEKQVKPA